MCLHLDSCVCVSAETGVPRRGCPRTHWVQTRGGQTSVRSHKCVQECHGRFPKPTRVVEGEGLDVGSGARTRVTVEVLHEVFLSLDGPCYSLPRPGVYVVSECLHSSLDTVLGGWSSVDPG